MPMTYDKRQLNEFIIEHFTDEELRILCAVEFRDVYDPVSRYNLIGFRVAEHLSISGF